MNQEQLIIRLKEIGEQGKFTAQCKTDYDRCESINPATYARYEQEWQDEETSLQSMIQKLAEELMPSPNNP